MYLFHQFLDVSFIKGKPLASQAHLSLGKAREDQKNLNSLFKNPR